jgi:hypothetical protein
MSRGIWQQNWGCEAENWGVDPYTLEGYMFIKTAEALLQEEP